MMSSSQDTISINLQRLSCRLSTIAGVTFGTLERAGWVFICLLVWSVMRIWMLAPPGQATGPSEVSAGSCSVSAFSTHTAAARLPCGFLLFSCPLRCAHRLLWGNERSVTFPASYPLPVNQPIFWNSIHMRRRLLRYGGIINQGETIKLLHGSVKVEGFVWQRRRRVVNQKQERL